MLRDRFVLGVEDEAVVRKLRLEEKLTLDKAISLATAAEEVRTCQQAMKTASNDSQVNLVDKRKQYEKFNRSDGKTDTKQFQNCSFCGRKDEKGKCPAYGKACAKCNRKNHFVGVCRSTVTTNIDSDTSDVQSGGIRRTIFCRCLFGW